jgi:hypothetical protein
LEAEAEAERSKLETNRSSAHTFERLSHLAVDKDGNVIRALAWTWPILKRRRPHKYRWWMNRVDRAREPTPEALAALTALQQAAGG